VSGLASYCGLGELAWTSTEVLSRCIPPCAMLSPSWVPSVAVGSTTTLSDDIEGGGPQESPPGECRVSDPRSGFVHGPSEGEKKKAGEIRAPDGVFWDSGARPEVACPDWTCPRGWKGRKFSTLPPEEGKGMSCSHSRACQCLGGKKKTQ